MWRECLQAYNKSYIVVVLGARHCAHSRNEEKYWRKGDKKVITKGHKGKIGQFVVLKLKN